MGAADGGSRQGPACMGRPEAPRARRDRTGRCAREGARVTGEAPNGRATSPKWAEYPVQLQGRAGHTARACYVRLWVPVRYLGMYPRSRYVYTVQAHTVCLYTVDYSGQLWTSRR